MPSLLLIARRATAAFTACLLVSTVLVAIAVVLASPRPAGATSSLTAASLEPEPGQYVPIAPVDIYDTRTGIGGAPSSLAPGATSGDIPVAGFALSGQSPAIPSTGATSAFVSLQVLSATGSGTGYISDYEADISNPGQASVSYGSGLAESGSDAVAIAPVGTSGAGDILVTNNGSLTITFAIQVEGYFTDGSQSSPGDTYVGLPSVSLQSQTISANSSLSFPITQDAINDGVISQADSSNVDALAIQVGTINPTAAGYLSYVDGSDYCYDGQYVNLTSTLRDMSFQSEEKDRLSDIVQPELTSCSSGYSGGPISIFNHGTSPVAVQIKLQGYFINPSVSDIAGAEYQPLPDGPAKVCDTRADSGVTCEDETGHAFTGAIPAYSSVNVLEAGVAGIPSAASLSAVANEIDALEPDSTGWLTVSPYSATGQDQSTQPAVNFSSAYPGADVSFQAAVATQTSSGAITIYNDSPGTVEIAVSARGYWLSAQVPQPPGQVQSSYSNGDANVSWSDSSDGGAAIQSFTVYTSSGGSITVGGTSSQATLLANGSDQVSVYASNEIGSGQSTPPVPVTGPLADPTATVSYPLTISGTVAPPDNSGADMSGIQITIYAEDEIGMDGSANDVQADGEIAPDIWSDESRSGRHLELYDSIVLQLAYGRTAACGKQQRHHQPHDRCTGVL